MELEFPNAAKIKGLASIIDEQLTPRINSDFVLLDVPNHRNIGDSLIWEGELEYFKRLRYEMISQYNRNTYNGRHIDNNTTILLHGGGNFGDIYSTSQNFRLHILERYPDNPIIMLPQSLHYSSDSKMQTEFERMSKHRRLTICLRDNYSYGKLEPYFEADQLLLTPDMAFMLDFSKFYKTGETGKNLYMQRTDAEVTPLREIRMFEDYGFQYNNTDVLDWPSYSNNRLLNYITTKADALESKLSGLVKDLPGINHLMDPAFGFKSNKNRNRYVNKGIIFLNAYDNILTTRLHGMILGILLGKKVFILDNSYGKNAKFYSTWLNDFSNLQLINK